MPDFPDIIGAAGLALAFVAFYIGFKRHKEAMVKQDDSAKAEDKRHTEAMAKEDDRHKEAMAKEDRRHTETMTKEDKRHTEAMTKEDNRHAEAMTALQALIHNTAPRPGPAE